MYTFERFLLSLWLLSYVLGDLLYYRVGSGNVYGPFPEQQLQEWVMAGYFGNDENLFVSATNQAESFQKYHDYIVPTQMERRQGVVGDANVRGMRKNFLRTAASFVKLDAKKLDRIKKFVVSATNKGIVAPRYTDFDKSAQYTSDVMYERKFDGPVPVAESIPIATKNDSEFAQKEKERESLISVLEDAAREEKFVSETGVKPAGESAPDGESDESLLQLIKRDNVEDAVKYPGKLKNSYVERRTSNTKQPKAIKVSVKSLPKVDNSLWDSEQDNAKAAAALRDEFLAELQQQTQTSGVRSVEQSDNHNFSRLSSSQGRARSRALRKLSILLWEIGRFLLSQFASLIPGPIRASSNYVAFLLRNASDRPVFMQLCGLFVLQVLRILLYIAAVPCTYDAIATFSGVASVVSRPIPSTTGMQVDGFEAAAAGSIVTSVLMEQLPSTFHTGQSSFPAQEPSDKVTLMHMLAAVLHYLRQFPHCFASPAVSYRMLLTFGSNINLRNIQAGLSHGGKTVRTIVAQFRHTPPAVLALSLVMFCIVMIDAVVVPWMQSSASLGYIAEPVDVACAGDDDESSGGVDADDADDLLDAAHIRKKHGACEPAWLLLSTDIVKPRVAAAPYVAYIQHVFAHTTQLIMWSWLACQIFPHLAVVLDTTGLLDAKVLCLPIGLVLVGGVVELYLTPSSEVATTTGTADIAAPNKEKSSALFHSRSVDSFCLLLYLKINVLFNDFLCPTQHCAHGISRKCVVGYNRRGVVPEVAVARVRRRMLVTRNGAVW